MKYNNIKEHVSLYLILISLFWIMACPLMAQVVQKKSLTPADYALFGVFQYDKSTKDGYWVSFKMKYRNGKDTLFVKNTSNHRIYSFATAVNTVFVGKHHFAYTVNADLHLLNLEIGKQQIISSATNYSYSSVFDQLIVIAGNETTGKALLILDHNGNIRKKIAGAISFKMSPCGKKAIYVTKYDGMYSLGLLALDKLNVTQWIVEKSPNDFKTLTWEKQGRSLAFINRNKITSDKSQVFYYRTDNNLLYMLEPEKQLGFPSDKTIDNPGYHNITISDDLKSVFFGIGLNLKMVNSAPKSNLNSAVEVWNGNDKWIYPMEQKDGQFDKLPTLAVWFPLVGEFMPISSALLPKVTLAGNEQYALLSNPKEYEPQFDLDGPRDYYITNLQTKERELFLRYQSTSPTESPRASPGGKYITYMRKNKFWIYDLRAKLHKELPVSHINDFKTEQLFTVAGWTPDDKEIVIYDQYDIYIIEADGSNCKRLTAGREKQIEFRIDKSSIIKESTVSFDGLTHKVISLANGLILKAKGSDQKTGYFKWESKSGLKPLVYKDSFIDQLQIIEDGKAYIYQEQKFDQSPTLIFLKGKISHPVFQSNPQQLNYHWGTARLIEFDNSTSEKSKAILYYPAAYDPTKKYPMVVKIYEKQSQDIYKYQFPRLQDGGGFNPTVLTTQGYFVLCPDIRSEKYNEGPSALAATVSATKEVVSRGLVYPNKIGLIGHSFGGYETNYIITQTGLFAAAVAGAAINDIKGFYHTVDWDTGLPTMNYFITGQFIRERSPYEVPEIYANNSPIVYADKVNTPLLSYAGKADNHVDWHQSVEFYMALRRLKKKQIMLLYPEEGHVLLNPINQIDLSQRMLQWFDYYLKDEKPSEWISKGTN